MAESRAVGLTWIQIILVGLFIDQNLCLRQQCQHLSQMILWNSRGSDQFRQREGIVLVILEQNGCLEGARHQDIFLIEVVCAEFVFGVVPQPCQFATGVFHLVILLETFISG